MKSQLWSDKMLIPLAVISVHMNKINSERRELLFQQLLQWIRGSNQSSCESRASQAQLSLETLMHRLLRPTTFLYCPTEMVS